MLNRRILRIKAFKILYAYAENPAMTLKEALKQLAISCEATQDLYLYMLGIVAPLTQEAALRIEAARGKFNPTEEERNPNMKFARNALAPLLAEDIDLQKLLEKKKLSWEQQDAFLYKLYASIRTKDYFRAYMENPGTSLEEDVALFEIAEAFVGGELAVLDQGVEHLGVTLVLQDLGAVEPVLYMVVLDYDPGGVPSVLVHKSFRLVRPDQVIQ